MQRSSIVRVSMSLVVVAIAFATIAIAPRANAATPTPTVTGITLKNGVYKTTINKKTVSMRPFVNYTGPVWAKRVNFGTNLGSTYLFVAQSTNTDPTMKYYTAVASKLGSVTPFYGNHYAGYNMAIAVQPKTKQVFVAFGTKSVGASTRVLEISRKGFTQINNPTVAKTDDKGQVIVQFLKIYTNEYGLVTMIANNPATLKVWRYSAKTYRFDEDTSYDKAKISTSGNVLALY